MIPMRIIVVLACSLAFLCTVPLEASAQRAQSLVVGVGGGGTIYNIATRLGGGSTLVAMAGYRPTSVLLVEGTVSRHLCSDCDRFLIAEGGLQVGYPAGRLNPFLSGGYGVSADPGFMGTETGFYLGFGTWVRPMASWGAKLEARGRQVGPDLMGEATVLIARRFGSF